MYCQYCGHENSEESKYCAQCGRALVKEDFRKNRENRGTRKILTIAAAVLSVCAVILAGARGLGNEKPAEPKPPAEVSAVPSAADQWKQNILMPSEVDASIPLGGYRGSAMDAYVFGTKLWRSEISRVIFEDSVKQVPEDHWDVSLAQNDSVLAWVLPDGTDRYELHIAAEGGINGKIACKDLFFGYTNLEEVCFNECFHTEQTEDFSRMFYGCMWELEKLDLRDIRTDNAVDLSEMFANCVNLTGLDLSHFDTSHVKDMSGMFSNCAYLRQVDLEDWNTANVTNVSYMFDQCPAVENCDFTGMDFGKVEKFGAFAEDTVQIQGQPWRSLFSDDPETRKDEMKKQTVRENWATGSAGLTLLAKDHIRIELEEACFQEEAFQTGDKRLVMDLYHSEEDIHCYSMVIYNEENALQCHCSYLFAGSAANDYHPQDPTWSVSGSKVTIDMHTGDLVPWDVTELEYVNVYFYNVRTREYEPLTSFRLEF